MVSFINILLSVQQIHFDADVRVSPGGPTTQGDDPFDVVTRHHERNRAPRAPDPSWLRAVGRDHATTDADTGGDDAGILDEPEGSDAQPDMSTHGSSGREGRAPRHSSRPYTGRVSNNPKKLGFYPPQWRDVLEVAQKKWRFWMACHCGFPDRNKKHLDRAFACVLEALEEHNEKGGRVEKGVNIPFLSRSALTML